MTQSRGGQCAESGRGSAVVPIVHMFTSPSSHLCEDDSGVVRNVQQGEGGEQGDPLMPLLFCVGQRAALEEVQERLRPNERLFAYLDDVHVVSKPDRVGAIYSVLQELLWARIRVHGSKTHVWNQAGQKCARRCRGSPESPTRGHRCGAVSRSSTMQVIKVLGTPLGHPDYVATHLEERQCLMCSLLVLLVALCVSQSQLPVARGASRVGGTICSFS